MYSYKGIAVYFNAFYEAVATLALLTGQSEGELRKRLLERGFEATAGLDEHDFYALSVRIMEHYTPRSRSLPVQEPDRDRGVA